MKWLMYTHQLLYDSVYFAFEGEMKYSSHSIISPGQITPIGVLQQQTKRLFSSPNSTYYGVHIPTIAVLLDFMGGWSWPCDGRNVNWGIIKRTDGDRLADAVRLICFIQSSAGAKMHDESSYISPTRYGDAMDVLLSDALVD